MRRIAVAAAVCTLCSILAPSAYGALEFKESGMGMLSIASSKKQVFKTAGGEIDCETITVEKVAASEAELNAEWQLLEVKYSKCTVFAFIDEPGFKVMYDFNINGYARIENSVLIEVLGCDVEIPGAPANQHIASVYYVAQSGGTLEIVPEFTNIESYGGGFCSYNEEPPNNKGTYKGSFVLQLLGYKIEA